MEFPTWHAHLMSRRTTFRYNIVNDKFDGPNFFILRNGIEPDIMINVNIHSSINC